MKRITPEDLKRIRESDKPFDLVDVRSNKEYRHNHIPGAVNVPFEDDFKNLLDDTLMGGGDILIVVYDAHEKSDIAQKACKVIEKEMEYEKVACLGSGIMHWIEEGGEVEFGRES